MEYEFRKSCIPFERGKEYLVNYKNNILAHKFYADFVVFDKIILEVEGVSALAEEFTAQSINYLKVSQNQLAILVNFGELKLNYRRIIL